MAKKEKSFITNKIYGERTKYQYLDIIISSGIIKREFFERCLDMQVDPVSVAMSVGIAQSSFYEHYVKNPCPSASQTLPQEKFINMLELVGIDVKVVISKLSVEDTIKRNQKLGRKIYKR
jgi:hypothetical protein